MKETIAELLDPAWRHYTPLGYMALAMRELLSSAKKYRDEGRWGWSGPTEILNGSHGCVNATGPWSTGRMRGYSKYRDCPNDMVAHRSHMADCILSALCSDQTACVRWREAEDISLKRVLSVHSRKMYGKEEDEAVAGFFALHKRAIKATLNSSHPKAKTICHPRIFVDETEIYCDVYLTYARDIQPSWKVAEFLLSDGHHRLRENLPARPDYIWKPCKQTFAEWLRTVTKQFSEL